MYIKESIKDLRKEKGLTQKQLAEQMGVSVRWVQKLEAGSIRLQNITFLHGVKLIQALTSYDLEKQIARDAQIILYRMLQDNY